MIFHIEYEVSGNEHSPDWRSIDIEAESEEKALEILEQREKYICDSYVHPPDKEEKHEA